VRIFEKHSFRPIADSAPHQTVVEPLANQLNRPDDVQNDFLPPGELRCRNQAAWAQFDLVREGSVDSSRRWI